MQKVGKTTLGGEKYTKNKGRAGEKNNVTFYDFDSLSAVKKFNDSGLRFIEDILAGDVVGGVSQWQRNNAVEYGNVINEAFSDRQVESRRDFIGLSGSANDAIVEEIKRQGTVSRFTKLPTLEQYWNSLTKKVGGTRYQKLSETKKLKFTDNEKGVFSFDMAASGMYPVMEYYSDLIKRVVDPFMVTPIRLSNGDYEYEYKGDDKYPKHKVEQRVKHDEDGNPIVESTIKRSYIEFPKKNLPSKIINFVINGGFSAGVDADDIIYNSFPVLYIADVLTKMGYSTNIYVTYGVSGSGGNEHITRIRVKSYSEPFDRNAIATALSDPAFFRMNVFQMFRVQNIDSDTRHSVYGLGIPLDNNTINNYYSQINSDALADTFFANQSLDERQATREIDRLIDLVEKTLGITV